MMPIIPPGISFNHIHLGLRQPGSRPGLGSRSAPQLSHGQTKFREIKELVKAKLTRSTTLYSPPPSLAGRHSISGLGVPGRGGARNRARKYMSRVKNRIHQWRIRSKVRIAFRKRSTSLMSVVSEVSSNFDFPAAPPQGNPFFEEQELLSLVPELPLSDSSQSTNANSDQSRQSLISNAYSNLNSPQEYALPGNLARAISSQSGDSRITEIIQRQASLRSSSSSFVSYASSPLDRDPFSYNNTGALSAEKLTEPAQPWQELGSRAAFGYARSSNSGEAPLEKFPEYFEPDMSEYLRERSRLEARSQVTGEMSSGNFHQDTQGYCNMESGNNISELAASEEQNDLIDLDDAFPTTLGASSVAAAFSAFEDVSITDGAPQVLIPDRVILPQDRRIARIRNRMARGPETYFMPYRTSVVDFAYPPGYLLRGGPAVDDVVELDAEYIQGSHGVWAGFEQKD